MKFVRNLIKTLSFKGFGFQRSDVLFENEKRLNQWEVLKGITFFASKKEVVTFVYSEKGFLNHENQYYIFSIEDGGIYMKHYAIVFWKGKDHYESRTHQREI